MEKMYEFNLEIKKVPDINGAYVEIPLDVKAEFGKARVAVHVTFDAEEYDGQLVKMGTPNHIIGVRKDIREKIGKQAGDVVHVVFCQREQKKPEYSTVEAYIAQYTGDVRLRMEKMREIIKSCSPDITEKISWAMPTFVFGGNLVHFAAQKAHIGFYPAPETIVAFADKLTPYKSTKGGVQFPNSAEIPYELIRDMVQYRLAQIRAERT